jgi:hypothetical protein
MAIESQCPGCRRTLRVADEFAGQHARCPLCGTIYTVPAAQGLLETVGTALEDSASRAEVSWRLRTPEGQLFGPVAKSELDQWVADGRVTGDCELMIESEGGWRAAADVYPVLSQPGWVAPAGERAVRGTQYRYIAPHRGGLVLSLGVVSWIVSCPLFGLLAWIMGSADLREMRAGRMDPTGRASTQAGQILGVIHSLVCLALVVVALFLGFAGLAGF